MTPFQIDIITIFPPYFKGPLQESLMEKAQAKGRLQIQVHDLRKYTRDRHKTVDDKPFGGGPGMILKPEPIFECVEAIQKQTCHSEERSDEVATDPPATQWRESAVEQKQILPRHKSLAGQNDISF